MKYDGEYKLTKRDQQVRPDVQFLLSHDWQIQLSFLHPFLSLVEGTKHHIQ